MDVIIAAVISAVDGIVTAIITGRRGSREEAP